MMYIKKGFKKISVIGGSRIEENSTAYDLAYQVGKNIALNSAILVCGGLGGVMEAACRGAREGGGLTIGILPSTDENTANSWVDIKIPTGLGYARNVLVVLSADAVIAVDGALGTLTEIGYALTFSKPLIGINTWKVRPYRKIHAPGIITADSAEEAVRLALEYIEMVKKS
jgi:uncharacterized protein (TIGR00725 family)